MNKITDTKTFISSENGRSEEEANEWLKKFYKEDRSKRKSWNDESGNYCVEATGINKN